MPESSTAPRATRESASPESVAAAKEAGLRYVTADQPGLIRKGRGPAFKYLDAKGRVVRDRATLDRIRALAIPPAWTEVWICSLAHGHLQATGRDVRGRKQYRYHEEWNSVRGTTKYERVIAFGRMLPRIRRRVRRDLRREGLGREKVLAVVVQLLEATLIRVGNEEYARENGSFGLTTLRDRHVTFNRGTVRFQFLGKSGKTHDVQLHDARLSRLVKRLQELPGQDLFQYIDETGERQKVTSEDINAYLREVAG
ncbi:MAG: topoisomerase, partial [Verrucomicrobia bacterium]|nr:topoisomerase [Verrucomicrobiota bacterium]